jgi:hypothetical protein
MKKIDALYLLEYSSRAFEDLEIPVKEKYRIIDITEVIASATRTSISVNPLFFGHMIICMQAPRG